MSNPASLPSSFLTRLRQQLRFGDYLVAALFLAFALASLLWKNLFGDDERAEFAQVVVQNKIIAELSLHNADTVSVRGTLGEVKMEIAVGGIRVLSSTCGQQVCVRQGRIARAPQMLVCVPNHLAVVLVGKKENKLDAVTF